MYNIRSGASPIPSPASYFGGRDIGFAQSTAADTQGGGEGRLREKKGRVLEVLDFFHNY
jgi:hypothetical protein